MATGPHSAWHSAQACVCPFDSGQRLPHARVSVPGQKHQVGGGRVPGGGAHAALLFSTATTFFHHVNLQYSTVSEFCTAEACQTMAVCNT